MRVWALEQPHRYLLIFGTPVPGYTGPDEATEAARRAMNAITGAIARLPLTGSSTRHEAVVEEQLADRPEPDLATGRDPGKLMRLGIRCWARVHGLVSLEIAGHFGPMGFDASILYEAEIDDLLRSMG